MMVGLGQRERATPQPKVKTARARGRGVEQNEMPRPVRNEMDMLEPIRGAEGERTKEGGRHPHEGENFFFCSHHCLAKFKEDPEKFLKSSAAHGYEHARAHAAPQIPKR